MLSYLHRAHGPVVYRRRLRHISDRATLRTSQILTIMGPKGKLDIYTHTDPIRMVKDLHYVVCEVYGNVLSISSSQFYR